ncbi:MAG: hypothetical protein JW763_05370 [candidate division Zixibacteria bacterium]|nr:hypothetical protein [candidate division Zixibacteria bacterium]
MKIRICITIGILGLLMVAGCTDEREIVTPTYQQQIYDFITRTEDGKQLFSQDLLATVPFARDESGDRYYYVTDSVVRSMQITIGTTPKDIAPYDDIYDALADVFDVFHGRLMRISGNDTTLAFKFRTWVSRYGYFLKLFDDAFPMMGWRFRGFYSEGNERNAERVITSSNGQIAITADGQFDDPPSPFGPHTTNYVMYDTIPVFSMGDSLTFSGAQADRFSVRTSPTTVKCLSTSLNNLAFEAGWRTSGTGEPFNRLVLVEGEEKFQVNTIDADPPIVESTLVRYTDYVVFYKIQ